MKKKEDYRGWALCCIAREIQRAWVKKTWGGARWLTRLGYFHKVGEISDYTLYESQDIVGLFIRETKHAHWPGKAAMIRELKRQLDDYHASHPENS